MGTSNKFTKDPDAISNFGINWATWLGSDTITASSWTVETGITKVTDTNTTTATTIWLSGGTSGNTYAVRNVITTVAGNTEPRTLYITVDYK